MTNKNNTGGIPQTTIAPVAASPANNAEFVDAPGLQSLFGIKRSLSYVLLDAGLIRGVSLRRLGQTKGKRLFNVQSVRDYLNAQMAAPDPDTPTKPKKGRGGHPGANRIQTHQPSPKKAVAGILALKRRPYPLDLMSKLTGFEEWPSA